ncbi:hypothetical protein ACEN2J_17770 [Pseudorhodobacter sp. W20_MBD10_FR17]|uniref:hypothetical protein n=1 Tax=Pseudorhodobacter sp. W20_MBD10_FR17 TaxID=3240266 RepID=UPI003F9AAEEC
MKLSLITAIVLALSVAIPSVVLAQDQARERDQLYDCGSLDEKDCADLLRIRDQLKDCDGVTSDACAALLKDRDRLQNCAIQDKDKDQTKNQDRDGTPETAGSAGSDKN